MSRIWNHKPMPRTRFEEMVNLSKILKSIFVASLVATATISINVIPGGVNPATISVAVLFFLILGLYWVYKQGFVRASGVGLLISTTIVVTINLVTTGGIHDNAMIVFPLLIAIAGLVLGKPFIPYLTGLILAEISVLYWLSRRGLIRPFDGAVTVKLTEYLTAFVLLVTCGVIIWITLDTLERNLEKIIDSEARLANSYDKTIIGWGKALELFDRNTEGHSLRVVELTLTLARKLGVKDPELEHIRRGALLHDIGKMAVDENVLNKPGSLTEQERRMIETHPLNAQKLLKDIPFLERAMDIPVYHHERWDGTGYPFHLAGEEIPLAARIFALVDNWDALCSDRPYHKAWSKDEAVHYIRSQSGKKFDPVLVEPFLALVE